MPIVMSGLGCQQFNVLRQYVCQYRSVECTFAVFQCQSEPYPVDILPGEKMEIIYTGIFNHFATAEYPDAGSYTLYLVNESTNTIISDGMGFPGDSTPDTVKSVVSPLPTNMASVWK